MATDHKSHVSSYRRASIAPEEEVYGLLGSLLGTLEVVSSDDAAPLAPNQAERIRSAVRLCYGLQHQIEALLTLSADDLSAELRLHDVAVRPMIEHAVRGAVRSFASRGIELRTPSTDDWGRERVRVDPSRTDRMLKAVAEALAASVGQHGALEVLVEQRKDSVALTLLGHPGGALVGKHAALEPTLASSALLLSGAERLFTRQGGSFSCDLSELRVCLQLPIAGSP